MPRPDLMNTPEWYRRYVDAVKEDDLIIALKHQTELFDSFFNNIPIDKREFQYAEGKWTIKEIIQHIIDAERVFSYRVLRFARKDVTPLSGFDENKYADNAKTDKRNWDDLLQEFNAVRLSIEMLFKSFDEDQLNASGIASGNQISVLTIGFIIVGHANHHIQVIKERYL